MNKLQKDIGNYLLKNKENLVLDDKISFNYLPPEDRIQILEPISIDDGNETLQSLLIEAYSEAGAEELGKEVAYKWYEKGLIPAFTYGAFEGLLESDIRRIEGWEKKQPKEIERNLRSIKYYINKGRKNELLEMLVEYFNKILVRN